MKPTKILLIEDDRNLGTILQESLEQCGYAVTLAEDGNAGRTEFLQGNFDLCLLDVMMPKKDGFTLAAEIRKLNQQLPIIFLTAKSLKEDRIEGFKIGGDDYVTKPFSMEELLLRIHAVLKRTMGNFEENRDAGIFTIGEYQFDFRRQILQIGAEVRKLTHKENELLKLLCLHKNAILERELALKMIWGDDSFFNARSMDVFITKLRKYLGGDIRIKILNVPGRGFRLVVDAN
jgi:DNA-binding response OmpR family regulator